MSFACLAKIMKSHSVVVSFDFRGHADHYCENETDMSEERENMADIKVCLGVKSGEWKP